MVDTIILFLKVEMNFSKVGGGNAPSVRGKGAKSKGAKCQW